MRISGAFTFVLAVGFSLFVSAEARAERATQEEMELVCRNWLLYMVDQQGSWAGEADPRIVDLQEIIAGDVVVGRCFSIAPRGCVVVPVLKELPPIKAYSEECGLDVSQTVGFPQLLREVLEHRVALFVQQYGSPDASQPPTGMVLFDRVNRQGWDRFRVAGDQFQAELARGAFMTRGQVGPLLTTAWSQGWPYNKDCPMGDGGRTVAGCMATAAAQIMKYHDWPPNGIGDFTYTWDGDDSCGETVGGEDLYADFSDSYDWANMPNSCSDGCTPTQEDSLGELCYEVGASFQMDYGCCGSGAYFGRPISALPTYFDYSDSIQWEDRSDYSAETWFGLIVAEINAGRPMMYSIVTSGSGHAIVCDGWRDTGSQNEYHMNYGWGGSWTGWYAIDNLSASIDPLAETLLRDIKPADHVTPNPDPMTFQTLPYATSESQISMKASLAYDPDDESPPVYYAFNCYSGGPSCEDRDYAGPRTYNDYGLSPNTEYAYRVRARDNASPPNETDYSDPASVYTFAAVPGAPTLDSETACGMDITIDPNGNPSYTRFAIYCSSSPDPNWNYYFVDASGNPSASMVWQTLDDWGTITAVGMQPDTQYCFQVGAKNEDGVQSGGGPEACLSTHPRALILSVGGCRDHGGAGELCLDLTAGGPGQNLDPRLGGIQTLRFVMDTNVCSVTASASCSPTSYFGTVTPSADGSDTVVVTFSPGLSDEHCCEITLGGDANDSAFVVVLVGDANRDGSVSTADNSGIKQRLEDPVVEGNCQYDVNVDGMISAADTSSAKARLENIAPSCPP